MEQRIALDGKASWRGVGSGMGGQPRFGNGGKGCFGSLRGPSRFLLYRTR